MLYPQASDNPLVNVLDKCWPIGSIFSSMLPANPAEQLGFGVWVPHGPGRSPICVDLGDSDFDAAGDTFGAKTVTLTEAQIPAHTHVQNAHGHTQDPHTHTIPVGATDDTSAPFDRADAGTNAAGANATTTVGSTTATTQTTAATNQNTGGGLAHNNMHPVIAEYRWKRTA